MVNALQPGAGVDPALAKTLLAEGAARAGSIIQSAHESKSGVEAVVAIVPNNFFNAMSQNDVRSEEHTSELQSLMRISYAVFCLKKKIQHHTQHILYY